MAFIRNFNASYELPVGLRYYNASTCRSMYPFLICLFVGVMQDAVHS